jgi:hypothetical protein
MLTLLEKDVLRAFWRSQYVDGDEQPSTWTWDVVSGCEHATTKNVAGVFASLVKKGFVTVSGNGKEAQADVTEAGFDAALAAGLIVGTEYATHAGGMRVDWRATSSALVATPAPRKAPTTATKMTAKNARRIVRAYLRAAIEMHTLADEKQDDAALVATFQRLDTQLDEALATLAR